MHQKAKTYDEMQNKTKQTNMGFGINSRLTTSTHITDTITGAIFKNFAAFVE